MKRFLEVVGATLAVSGWMMQHPAFLDFFWWMR